jgi:hypothetical protein
MSRSSTSKGCITATDLVIPASSTPPDQLPTRDSDAEPRSCQDEPAVHTLNDALFAQFQSGHAITDQAAGGSDPSQRATRIRPSRIPWEAGSCVLGTLAAVVERWSAGSVTFAAYAEGWLATFIDDAPDRARFEAALQHRTIPVLGKWVLLEVLEVNRDEPYR